MKTTKINGQACSKNTIGYNSYIDICASVADIKKKLSSNKQGEISVNKAKFFEFAPSFYVQTNGLKRHFNEDYQQNQIIANLGIIENSHLFSSVDFTFGENIEGRLATKQRVNANLQLALWSKPFTLSLGYERLEGGALLGVVRNDDFKSISMSFPIYGRATVKIGYQITDSTIDYYDLNTPIISIGFNALSF